MDLSGQLQSHPLFATFTPEAPAQAVRLGTAVTYGPGDVCIRYDEAGEVFGVLVSGRLEAVRGGGTPSAERLGYIEPGECFGEMSMLTGNPTTARVVACEASEAVIFLQEAISPVIAMNLDAFRFLGKLIARRLGMEHARPRVTPPQAPKYALGAIEPMRILAVICRQDDVRYAYFDTTSETALLWGQIGGIGSSEAVHVVRTRKGEKRSAVSPALHEAALEAAVAAVTTRGDGGIDHPGDLSVIGHCVRHGGAEFNGPVIIDLQTKAQIRRFAGLAPLDNPYNLAGIEACERLAPRVPEVAVFDTAFHLTMPQAACRYALPHDLAHDRGLRRFGSHGISHEGAGRAAAAFLGAGFDALRITLQVGRGQVAEISAPHGRVRVLVVGSDEERTIARHAARALSHARVTHVMRQRERTVPINISAHHVHLSQQHVEVLFGPAHALTWHGDLTQPGQYACKEQVNLVGPKGRIERVRVLGPVRPESQVEIARTEEYRLGIDAPVRQSGDLDGTPGITLEGPAGQVRPERGVICAMRHIHMYPEDAMAFAVRVRDIVRIRVAGERSLIFGDVVVRVHAQFRLDMHIDTDEANAAQIGPHAVGYLDSIQQRATA
jgi:propanediol utilization protein/CRP-like cAMP-binding protein